MSPRNALGRGQAGQAEMGPDPSDQFASHAEELLRSGDPAGAATYSLAHVTSSVSAATRSRLLGVRGMALFEQGIVGEALSCLRDGVAAAETCTRKVHFGSALALFSRESQFQAPDEALPALSRLRQLATLIGEAEPLGALHLVVARLEACRGHCVNARRHLEISRRLLDLTPRPSSASAIELIDAGLEMYGGNLGRASRAARTGNRRAKTAGLNISLAGSLTNLGSMLLFTGQLGRAKECLSGVLSSVGGLLWIKLGALDSLAQLALLEQDTATCRALLASCEEVVAQHRLPARSWYDLAHQLTRCAYYDQLGEWQRIVDICEAADPELARRQYKAVRTSLLCAKARALSRLGQHQRAETALATGLRACPRGAVDPLITLEATKALTASLRGDHARGSVHFDRALAACRAIGHRYHEAWIDRDRTDVARATRGSVPVARRELDVTETALLMSDVGTILGAGHSIDLLAHRMASILKSTTMGSRVEVEDESGCEYLAEPTTTWEAGVDGTFHIMLRGSDRRVELRVRGVQTIDEISLLKSLADLVQAAVNRTADTESEDEDQNLWPRTFVPSGEDTVFRSPRMIELLRVAARLAATDLPILITGETGTGKEIVARMMHDQSRVKRGPFVPFNCSALPRELVESQLFGHRRGAFTGATDSFPGVIRAAERGTLFLDEVGDLDPMTQPKFLRFLESAEIHPVGEARPQRVAVRIIAATNANLDTLADRGLFRRDLIYRLGVARINLPPLRERKDEIPALAALFATRYARECGRTGVRLGDDLIATLLLHDWPGNIRELANEVRRVVALADDGQTLTAMDLAPEIADLWSARSTEPAAPAAPSIQIRLDQSLSQASAELEQRFIEHAMHRVGGRVADAADLLGLSRKGLFLKRRRRGLMPTEAPEA
jgi:DNA-binding NtrC family response regulator